MPLADTLLHLAAGPRLYLPKWTDEIMSEVSRNLIEKFDVPEEKTAYRESGGLERMHPRPPGSRPSLVLSALRTYVAIIEPRLHRILR
jgi:hypothetical protein